MQEPNAKQRAEAIWDKNQPRNCSVCWKTHRPGDCNYDKEAWEKLSQMLANRPKEIMLNGRMQCAPDGCDIIVGGCYWHSDRC